MSKKYSGYTAHIYMHEEAPSAAAKGEAMKANFPGADYDLVKGDPCGQCCAVDGKDRKTKDQILDWINSHG